MPQVILTPFASSTRVYKGNPDCPRTVVLQQENLPGGGGDRFIEAVFFCTEKDRLDNSPILPGNNTDKILSGIFADGIAIGKTLKDFNGNFKNVFTIILEDVRGDIFVRGNYFDVTTQIAENDKPIFLNVEVF